MSMGAGVVLFVIGAILAFATDFEVGGVNFDLIGYILMGAGVVTFFVGLAFALKGRSTKSVTANTVDPASGQSVSETRNTTSGI